MVFNYGSTVSTKNYTEDVVIISCAARSLYNVEW
jgi:hypothetical protein